MTKFVEDNFTYTGMYRGLVLDNVDTEQKGRIKVRVYPMFESIDSEFLPWAAPAMPLFDGAGVNAGCLCIPKVNSLLWVFFEAGDVYQPVYFAEAQDMVHGIPTLATVNYPNRKVWKTSSGLNIHIDDTINEVGITHPSGMTLVISGDGSVSISSPSNITITGSVVNINP